MQHPRVKFGFVSSMIRKNILPIIQEIFKNDQGFLYEHMFEIFDQDFNSKGDDITGEPYSFVRNLDKILGSDQCK